MSHCKKGATTSLGWGIKGGSGLSRATGEQKATISCPHGVNVLEREIHNDHKAYQGPFLVSTKYSESVDGESTQKAVRLRSQHDGRAVPSGVLTAAT